MKEKMCTKETFSPKAPGFPISQNDVISLAEQRQLISGSYCHQYGILIRLALFTGLRPPELLGLQWNDLDANNCGLHIQHQFTYDCNGSGPSIKRISPRFIPIPASLFKELAEWYETQNSILSMYNLTAHSNSVAATIKGHQISSWLLEYYFKQILQFCGLPNYPLSALRHTFSVNAIMRGMDIKTLCSIMDEPNVQNIYAQYISDKTITGKYYNTVPNDQIQYGLDIAYPAVVRNLANGLIQLYAPNFPELTCAGSVLAHGLIIMREKMENELRCVGYYPTPMPVGNIHLAPDECIVQISVNL